MNRLDAGNANGSQPKGNYAMAKSHIQEIRALVESGDVDLGDYRREYKSAKGKPTSLTDDQIIEIIAVKEAEDPASAQQHVAWMVEAEGVTGTSAEQAMSAGNSENRVLKAAKYLQDSDTFDNGILAVIDADEIKKRGPVNVAIDLQIAYADAPEGEGLESFPTMGTEEGKDGVNNPDIYKRLSDGKKVSFFNRLWETSRLGKKLADQKNAIGSKGNAPTGEFAYLNGKESKLESERKRITSAFNNGRSVFRKAVQVLQQMDAIGALPGVKVTMNLRRDDHGNPLYFNAKGEEVKEDANGARPQLERTVTPITVYHEHNRDNFAVVSVPTFLAYSAEYARQFKEAGKGTFWEGLMDSKNATPETDKNADDWKPENLEEAGTYAAGLATFFEDMTKDKKSHEKLLKAITGDDIDDHTLLSFDAFYLAWDGIRSKIEGKLRRIQAEIDKAEGNKVAA